MFIPFLQNLIPLLNANVQKSDLRFYPLTSLHLEIAALCKSSFRKKKKGSFAKFSLESTISDVTDSFQNAHYRRNVINSVRTTNDFHIFNVT